VTFSLLLLPFPFSGQVYQPIFRKIESKLQSHGLPPMTLLGIDIHQQALTCSNWKPIINEIIQQIEQQRDAAAASADSASGNQPLIGVGHSVGGALLTIVASQRPDLLQKLIVIDSPYFHYKKRFVWGLGLKLLPESVAIRLNPMVKKARSKLDHWESLDSARQYLQQRNVFREMSSEIFESFLSFGLMRRRSDIQRQGQDQGEDQGQGQGEGVELVFPRDAEANLMLTFQIELPLLSKPAEEVGQYQINPQLSGYFLYSKRHDFLDKEDIDYVKGIFPKSFSFIEYDHSHFWPMIQPEEFSEEVSELIRKLCMSQDKEK
jgi:pimeloyl-ACP methyl ester carboxylesterase